MQTEPDEVIEPVQPAPRGPGRPTVEEAAERRAAYLRTSTGRTIAWRQRLLDAGWRSKTWVLPPEVIAALRAACERERCSEADYISRLILRHDEVI
jgi:hypothetical protein